MIAWYGEQKLKDAALDRLREHRRLDQLTQGVYFQGGRGCHLGCLTHCSGDEEPHAATERMFGIELRVAHWLEAVFEGLPEQLCGWWAVAATEAIPAGADLSRCYHHLAAWLLGDESPTAKGNGHELVRDVVRLVQWLHERAASGEVIARDTWPAARLAADSAARSAARSAACSAYSAADSAYLAADSAYLAARSAACSAARSAACSAARSAAWKAIADKSIEIFRSAPVAVEIPAAERCDECVVESLRQLAAAPGGAT